MPPLVSAILSVYNGEPYLSAALDSLLEQTYAPLEIIAVNDGSHDRTEAILRGYGPRVRSFSQPNRGQPAAINYGLGKARGAYIAFLDADDLHAPEKTARQVAWLEKRPSIDFVFGHVEQFLSPELSPDARSRWVCPPGAAPGYLAAAGLFRRECFERVGSFNETQKIGVFIEWYMRAEEAGLKHEVMAFPALQRRIHGNNMGIQHNKARLEYVQVVKAALQRRAHAQQRCG